MTEQQKPRFDLVNGESGVLLPFSRSHSHSEDHDYDHEPLRKRYDDQPVMISHYRWLGNRRSSQRCSESCVPSSMDYDEKNPSLDARQPEYARTESGVFGRFYSQEQGVDTPDGSVSDSPSLVHRDREDDELWTSEPTLSRVYRVDSRELYSMVAKRATNPMILEPEKLSGHSCNVTFKLFPRLDSRSSELTLCAEVSPVTHKSGEQRHYLSAMKVEAVVRDLTKTSGGIDNCLWSPVSDRRFIFPSSENSQPFYIFLRNLMSHCSLFYYCGRHEYLDVHIKCWERFTDSLQLDSDSGVFINSPT